MNSGAAVFTTPAPALVAFSESRRHLMLDLVRSGQMGTAAELCRVILDEDPETRRWLADEIVAAMEKRDLSFAGDLAAVLTGIERGSEWFPAWLGGHIRPVPDARLSLGKLRHDLNQFEHLRRLSVCEAPLGKIISAYETAIDNLSGLGTNSRISLTAEDEQTVGRAYGRLVHLADAPRVSQALSSSWDRARIQRLYLGRRPSAVVIDDFLTVEALDSLLRFCQDSTIWNGNRYAHGRLSALFFTGFNAPLILQIAEEVREAFPLLIGDRHPLRQLWAFKNTDFLPSDSTIHADFAAINVNFWITPDAANLDSSSGGMVVYDLEAPLSWNFHQYNECPDLIRELIARRRPKEIRIPYRQNRAIIFNSDLFHATEAVCFQPDYLGCRINVTMLYGNRRLDEHHAEPEQQEKASVSSAAWRSAAFTRRRR
jgi:hypothetical protein